MAEYTTITADRCVEKLGFVLGTTERPQERPVIEADIDPLERRLERQLFLIGCISAPTLIGVVVSLFGAVYFKSMAAFIAATIGFGVIAATLSVGESLFQQIKKSRRHTVIFYERPK